MRTDADLPQFVISTIATCCNTEDCRITPQSDVMDLGVDSMALTTLASHVVARYECQWSEAQLAQLFAAARVSDIVELVAEVSDGRLPVRATGPASQ